MPIAITDEQLAIQASIREWAKRAATIEIVRSQEPGRHADVAAGPGEAAAGPGEESVDPAGAAARPGEAAAARGRPDSAAKERWSSLADLGVFSMGLSAALAEDSGGTCELAAALAQLTESLVPGPIMPTMLAGLALARCDDADMAGAALAAIACGDLSAAVALEPGTVRAVRRTGGTLALTGTSGPILGGGDTTHLLIGATSPDAGPLSSGAAGHSGNTLWFLLPANHPGIVLTDRAPADFSRSLADVSLAEAIVGPDSLLPGITCTQVRDLAAALAAVEAAAVANWCSRTAAEYAAVRQQFGRPIGAFQAVKHLCATMFCRAESAAVLAWDAARAIGEAPDELALGAAAAAAFSLDAAVDNAKDCIQVLGGIGFTWEHDAHLYLRRAVALRQLLGGSGRWRDRAATLAMAGERRRLTVDDTAFPGNTGAAGDELAAARSAASAVATEIAELGAEERRRRLADSGYAAPSWPVPYGLAASPAAGLVIDAELARAGLARPDLVIGGWAVPAILGHGSPAQQDRFARPTLRGEISWCQLFSEPEAGSDLASLRTRAERTEDGWLLTGQKVWTSLAREADWAICLARTDASAPKHKGLSYFLVEMNSPGIDVRPLREMTGREMFNQVFLDQVFVPDDCVVGKPGDGWRIARTTLASERVAMGTGSSVGAAVEQLLALAGGGAAADPVFRQQLGALVSEGMAVSLLDLQAVLAQLRGADAGPLAAVRKLAGVAHRQAAAEAALELAGADAATADAAAAGFMTEFLLTRCLSIAGGTTQILLSLVAERLLGLPREEAR
ncbi:MAG: acyl-CoA dehydrogenase family protein [Streptosporangiaceae bacterium]